MYETEPEPSLEQQIEERWHLKLHEQIGSGGFGLVYRATDPNDLTGVTTAVKITQVYEEHHQKLIDQELDFLRDFQRLNGAPGILSLHRANLFAGAVVSQWEIADGTLFDELESSPEKCLSRELLLEFMEQAAIGLDLIHEQGLIHQDIKPANLFLVKGQVKVGDFGLSRFVGDASMKTQAQKGTPAYMSPQSWEGRVHFTNDLYALVISYIHLRTGTPQREAANLQGFEEAQELAYLRSCLAYRPEDRPTANVSQGLAARELIRGLRLACQTRQKPNADTLDHLTTKPEARDISSAGLKSEIKTDVRVNTSDERNSVSGPKVSSEESTAHSRSGKSTSIKTAKNTEKKRGGRKSRTKNSLVGITLGILLTGGLLTGFFVELLSPRVLKAPFSRGTAQLQQNNWARHAGLPIQVSNSIGMKFRIIPPGEYMMGAHPSPEQFSLQVFESQLIVKPKPNDCRQGKDAFLNEWEKLVGHYFPQHRVAITQPFYLGVFEVTQEQYEAVMGGHPSHYRQGRQFPVENVSWSEAVRFCRKLSDIPAEKSSGRSYRLPTEAEWEYACRAGTTKMFPFDSDRIMDRANVDGVNFMGECQDCVGHPQPVGQYPPNNFGLHDMNGNVWEWCQDRFEADRYSSWGGFDPVAPSTGKIHVLRGGSFEYPAFWARSASRGPIWSFDEDGTTVAYGTLGDDDDGFRVVMEIEDVTDLTYRQAFDEESSSDRGQDFVETDWDKVFTQVLDEQSSTDETNSLEYKPELDSTFSEGSSVTE